MAYSTDLRERVVEYIEAGNTVKEASQTFKVHRRTILRWRKMKEVKGTVEREPYKHGAIKLNDQELIKYVNSNPDLYLKDYAKRFNMTPSGIWYAFKRLHITLKKSDSI
jgi:transposase